MRTFLVCVFQHRNNWLTFGVLLSCNYHKRVIADSMKVRLTTSSESPVDRVSPTVSIPYFLQPLLPRTWVFVEGWIFFRCFFQTVKVSRCLARIVKAFISLAKKPAKRVRIEPTFFIENPAIALSQVTIVGCSCVTLAQIFLSKIKTLERFKEVSSMFAFGLRAVHCGRIGKAGKEIPAYSVERPASPSRSRTNKVPLAATKVFRNAFELNAVVNRLIAVIIVELYMTIGKARGNAYPT